MTKYNTTCCKCGKKQTFEYNSVGDCLKASDEAGWHGQERERRGCVRGVINVWTLRRREEKTKTVSWKIVGVTMGWDLKPHLAFEGGDILFGNLDRIVYPQYFQDGDWPTDPETHEKLPIMCNDA